MGKRHSLENDRFRGSLPGALLAGGGGGWLAGSATNGGGGFTHQSHSD